MKIEVRFPVSIDGCKDTNSILILRETSSIAELMVFSQASGNTIVTPPFPRNGQLVMACITGAAIHYQPMCFLSEAERAVYTPGTDVTVIDTPFGKIALCCGADIFQPQYARLAALKGCVLLAVSFPWDAHELVMEGPWSAAQANCLPIALAQPGGGQLILPCPMTEDTSGFGRSSFCTEELREAYKAFPVFDSLNLEFLERCREVLER